MRLHEVLPCDVISNWYCATAGCEETVDLTLELLYSVGPRHDTYVIQIRNFPFPIKKVIIIIIIIRMYNK
jgi:hypothetical protein